MIFRGGEEAAENSCQTNQEVVVATTTRNRTQVVQQNDQTTQEEQSEHQDRYPTRAFLDVLGNGRGVSGGRRHTVFVLIRYTRPPIS